MQESKKNAPSALLYHSIILFVRLHIEHLREWLLLHLVDEGQLMHLFATELDRLVVSICPRLVATTIY